MGARDQASGLRRLFVRAPTPVIAVASALSNASGRISDQTRLVIEFAQDFAAAGQQVAILDEHPAPTGVAQAFGMQTRRDFQHVLRGDYAVDDVAQMPEHGIRVIPAARAAGLEDFNEADEAALEGNLKLLKRGNDCVIVNCVHRAKRVLSTIARSAEKLVVLISASGDDLTRSYTMIKRIAMENVALPIAIVVVRAPDATQARRAFETLRGVAFEHLGLRLQYLGAAHVPGVPRASLLASERSVTPAGVFDALSGDMVPRDMARRDSVL